MFSVHSPASAGLFHLCKFSPQHDSALLFYQNMFLDGSLNFLVVEELVFIGVITAADKSRKSGPDERKIL